MDNISVVKALSCLTMLVSEQHHLHHSKASAHHAAQHRHARHTPCADLKGIGLTMTAYNITTSA